MKLIALLDDQSVIEKIIRHLKLWPAQAEPPCLSRARPRHMITPLPHQFLPPEPRFSHPSVTNRGLHVAQQTCCPEPWKSKLLLAIDR